MDAEKPLPNDFEALRAAILVQRDTLPRRIAQAAAFALDNPDEIAFGTAASIAASAGVQPSTLIRFAQHLGFDGFTSMQTVFRERLRARTSSYEDRLKALRDEAHGPAGGTILRGFLAAASRSLEAAAHGIEDEQFDKAVAALAGAETIYLVARRRSYPIASYLAYAFGKLKIPFRLVESAAGLEPDMLAFATPRDAAIAVSFSPYAATTIDSARTLVEQGVTVVAITDSAFSPLAQSASLWFEVAEADWAGFRSLSATMALAMALAVAVAERRGPEVDAAGDSKARIRVPY